MKNSHVTFDKKRYTAAFSFSSRTYAASEHGLLSISGSS